MAARTKCVEYFKICFRLDLDLIMYFIINTCFFNILVASSGLFSQVLFLWGYSAGCYDLLLYNTQQTDHGLRRTLDTIIFKVLLQCWSLSLILSFFICSKFFGSLVDYQASTQLRYQSVDNGLDNEPQVRTPICRNLEYTFSNFGQSLCHIQIENVEFTLTCYAYFWR